MEPRPLDHVVVAQRDLDASCATYAALGFTLTPRARHPFGTANATIQFANRVYLEPMAVERPEAVPETEGDAFSFAAFNRDFLAAHEGPSMVAVRSTDATADRNAFAAAGLQTYDLLTFERAATGPDGADRQVSFSLAFTGDPRLDQAKFMACQGHAPENYWFADYQRHANGAKRLDSVVMVAPDPVDYHEFLTHVTGQHDIRSTSLGIEFRMGDTGFEVMAPFAYERLFGEDAGGMSGRLAAVTIEVDDLAATRDVLDQGGIVYRVVADTVIVPAEAAHGTAIALFAT